MCVINKTLKLYYKNVMLKASGKAAKKAGKALKNISKIVKKRKRKKKGGFLSKHAVTECTKAVTKYTSTK